MADPSLYTYPSPLEGYEGLEPLPTITSETLTSGPDAKSYINDPVKQKSPAYTEFTSPLSNGTRGGFDVHIYCLQTDASEFAFATALHERIRREFPELRIYRVWDKPIGPHPVGMFEVNVFTPEVGWQRCVVLCWGLG
ncbi:hypothetical protein LTR73_000716 [Friedmanniomyces endolithicus]|nr:hypothetical protein LTR73_000716 [Friedmanniomyces endolithicus]